MSREHGEDARLPHPNAEEFLPAAIEDGAIGRALEEYRNTPRPRDSRFRNLNLAAIYFLTPANHPDIANIYPELNSNEAVRISVKKAISSLWSHTSPEIQQKFPLDEMRLAKPISIERRKKLSRYKSGLTASVADIAESGLTFEQIQETLGITRYRMNYAVRVLKRWGLEFPNLNKQLSQTEKNNQLEETLKNSDSDEEIQGALDQITRGFNNRQMHQEEPAILSLFKIVREAGLRVGPQRVRKFVPLLQSAQVPYKILECVMSRRSLTVSKYYFIAAKHKDRAIGVIRQNSELF